jgi:hypothetical protein
VATPESVRRFALGPNSPGPGGDLGMTRDDWYQLRDVIPDLFENQETAYDLLRRIGFPNSRRPSWDGNSGAMWAYVFDLLEKGLIQFPQRSLLQGAFTVYRYNPTFRALAIRYGLISSDEQDERASGDMVTATEAGPSAAPVPAPARPRAALPQASAEDEAGQLPPTCHVIVRAGSEAERSAAADVLAGLGLDPRDVWATGYATSFRVSSNDASAVRGLLDPTDISWVVVPADADDYLIRELYVTGPDGRRFRLVDAPAQQTVAEVAAGIMAQYGSSFAGKLRPTVMDRIGAGGQGERLPPDQTLHDAGVRDGAALRLGFEATAGAVNPLDHQDALRRMRNQILHFAKSRPDMSVRGAPPTLPSQYEITFVQPSFGPPDVVDGSPRPVSEHTVRVQFRADFPETPPVVFWESPIFHPNIYPMYDSDLARRRPLSRGLVCLGRIAESYTPSLSFAELCQTLIDVAAYRNYTVGVPTGAIAVDGSEVLTDDFYDPLAAAWARDHQPEIRAMGGGPMVRRASVTKPYLNAIEAID